MLAAFEGAGYRVSWRLLSSRRWLAQKRLRLYIVGLRQDLDGGVNFQWPSEKMPDEAEEKAQAEAEEVGEKEEEDDDDEDEEDEEDEEEETGEVTAEEAVEGASAVKLGRPEWMEGVGEEDPTKAQALETSEAAEEATKRALETSEAAEEATKRASLTRAHRRAKRRGRALPVLRDVLEPPGEATEQCSLTHAQWERIRSESFCAKSRRSERGRELRLDAPAPTLISSYHRALSLTTKYIFEEKDGTQRELPRFLTPRESARLMGFPEGYRLSDCGATCGEYDIYRQLGNAVCPPVIQAIAEQMLSAMRM